MLKEYPWRIAGAAGLAGEDLRSLHKRIFLTGGTLREKMENLLALPHQNRVSTEDFRRGDSMVKQYLLTSILTQYDSGLPPDPRTALLDHGTNGSLPQNRLYWQDFLEFGRQVGRGHLFVGTLPTTPVCEVAIAFGFHGAAYYLDTGNSTAAFCQEIGLLLADHPAVLAFQREEESLYACLLIPGTIRLDDETPFARQLEEMGL